MYYQVPFDLTTITCVTLCIFLLFQALNIHNYPKLSFLLAHCETNNGENIKLFLL